MAGVGELVPRPVKGQAPPNQYVEMKATCEPSQSPPRRERNPRESLISHRKPNMTPVVQQAGEPTALSCPFCGSNNISDGEILGGALDETEADYTQSECRECGAVGPRGHLNPGEIDYGSAKAIAAWNRRASRPQQPQAETPLPEPEHLGTGFDDRPVYGYTADQMRAVRLLAHPPAETPLTEPTAWMSPMAYGSKLTFHKPVKPEGWDNSDRGDDWYCKPLYLHPAALSNTGAHPRKVTSEMVNRFLGWKLPKSFGPDCGITFEPIGNKGSQYEYVREPTGTNLFDADQARAMLEHVLAFPPDAGWISVEDRLPEKFVEVLIAFEDCTLPATAQYTGNPHDIEGWCYPSENRGDGFDWTVTHWMPLPRTPTELAASPLPPEAQEPKT